MSNSEERQSPEKGNGLVMVLDDKTALIVIDVQEGLDDPVHGRRSNPEAERNMARLLAEWRAKRRPIFHVQHMSVSPNSTLRPDLPGNRIKRIVAPQDNEPVLRKTVSNAFVGTDLETRLRRDGIESVVLVGLTIDHCVSTTARLASDLGFMTAVVGDATAAHERRAYDGTLYPAEAVHAISLVTLQDEFAKIVQTAEIIGI